MGKFLNFLLVIIGGSIVIYGIKIYNNNDIIQQTNNFKNTIHTQKNTNISNKIAEQYLIGEIKIPKIYQTIDLYCPPENLQYKYLRKGLVEYTKNNLEDDSFLFIAGHNLRIGNKMFTKLHKLSKGDLVILNTVNNHTFTFIVNSKVTVDPYNLNLYEKYKNTKEGYLLLITCKNNGKNRLLILAKRKIS